MFLTSLHHLQCLFPTCSIVNALFKSTLKLLFFKKIQNKKNKKNKKALISSTTRENELLNS
jgi:hypothetical protein